jgi:glycosyltransferase involved in cell wall biosynthesis
VAAILFVSTVGDVGGAERCLLRLMGALDPARYVAALASPEGALARGARDLGLSVHALHVPSELDPEAASEMAPPELGLAAPASLRRKVTLAANVARSFAAAGRLARLIARERVALVSANSPRAAVVAGLAARLTRRPLLVHVRDIVHTPFARPLRRRALIALCDRAVAPSRATAAVVGGALPTDVVHDGMRAEDLRPARDRRPSDKAAPRLAMVGAMSPWKGHDVLLRAMPAILQVHSHARLTIYGGDGGHPVLVAYRLRLEALVAELGIGGAAVLAGSQPGIAERLTECDVFVHPPTGPDPFPAAVIEAAVAGCPIVATRTGGIPEIVDDGRSALLVAPGDAPALAAAVLEMLADPERARRLAAAAQRDVQRFTLEAQAAQMQRIYDELLSRP